MEGFGVEGLEMLTEREEMEEEEVGEMRVAVDDLGEVVMGGKGCAQPQKWEKI